MSNLCQTITRPPGVKDLCFLILIFPILISWRVIETVTYIYWAATWLQKSFSLPFNWLLYTGFKYRSSISMHLRSTQQHCLNNITNKSNRDIYGSSEIPFHPFIVEATDQLHVHHIRLTLYWERFYEQLSVKRDVISYKPYTCMYYLSYKTNILTMPTCFKWLIHVFFIIHFTSIYTFECIFGAMWLVRCCCAVP